MAQYSVYLRDHRRKLATRNRAKLPIASEDENENKLSLEIPSEEEDTTGSEDEGVTLDKELPVKSESEQLFDHTTSLDLSVPLPSSDLLCEIHAFTSDYYKYIQPAPQLYRSFTGSALIAIGILMEEHVQSIINPPLSPSLSEENIELVNDTEIVKDEEEYEEYEEYERILKRMRRYK